MNSEPFLIGQQLRRLAEIRDPRKYLHPDFFRTRRLAGHALAQLDPGPWESLSREEWLQWLTMAGNNGPRRFVLTTDAGVGKSVNLEWLLWRLSEKQRTCGAFLIKLGELATQSQGQTMSPTDFVDKVLVPRMLDQCGLPASHRDKLSRTVHQLRNRGELILLVDELDQVSASSAVVLTLQLLLHSPLWSHTSFVIGGRPYALQDCWDKLFAGHEESWCFLQVDGFTTQQQEGYLRDADGRSRYRDLPQETRTELQDILAVPRVLSYLRKLPTTEFQTIRTPSDIYERAVYHLVEWGLKKDRARELGRPPGEAVRQEIDGSQVRLAIKILSVLAWEMLWIQPPDASATAPGIPNFNRVGGTSQLDRLYERAYERIQKKLPHYDKSGHAGFLGDVERLKTMNEAIEHGIIDSKRMEQILWRNRSLQEFFAAYCLGTFCRDTDDTDTARLWDWVYLPHEARTEAFYWIWRFAAELSDNEVRPESWARAMSPLYRPGDGTSHPTKRSNEMLVRSWSRMERYGPDIMKDFLGEFQRITDDPANIDRQTLAVQFKSMFHEVPDGAFQMGTTADKQGMPENVRIFWAEWLQNSRTNPDDSVEQIVHRWSYPPGKRGEEWRDSARRRLRGAIARQDITVIENWQYPRNETPIESWRNPHIGEFLLHRYPLLLSWYRLFDPGHGLRQEWFAETLQRVSPTPEHPVIFVPFVPRHARSH